MKHWVFRLALLSIVLMAGAANAAVTCGMSVTNVYVIYNPYGWMDTQATGSVTLTCTRTEGEPYIDYWVDIDVPSQRLTRQNGNETLTYEILDNDYGRWNAMYNGTSGRINFTGQSAVASASRQYVLRIPRSNWGKPAGLYSTSILLTQRFSRTGPVISVATIDPVVSILTECRVSRSPTPLTLHYPSFSVTAVTGRTSFDVSCTMSTPYTMSLDATSGTLLGLDYSLALNAGSGTGNALPQTYSVTATIPANQSGKCATGICSATQPRTITITY
jgi:hypothetical protein